MWWPCSRRRPVSHWQSHVHLGRKVNPPSASSTSTGYLTNNAAIFCQPLSFNPHPAIKKKKPSKHTWCVFPAIIFYDNGNGRWWHWLWNTLYSIYKLPISKMILLQLSCNRLPNALIAIYLTLESRCVSTQDSYRCEPLRPVIATTTFTAPRTDQFPSTATSTETTPTLIPTSSTTTSASDCSTGLRKDPESGQCIGQVKHYIH